MGTAATITLDGGYNIGMHGHLSGALIADSFDGATEFGYRPYTGSSDILEAPAECGIKFYKTDGTGLLAGATISIYKAVDSDNDGNYEKGEKVISAVSIDEAPLIFDGLEDGKYILCEENAPTGYFKTSKEIHFEIALESPVTFKKVTIGQEPQYAGLKYVVDGEYTGTDGIPMSRDYLEDSGEFISAGDRDYYTFGNVDSGIIGLYIDIDWDNQDFWQLYQTAEYPYIESITLHDKDGGEPTYTGYVSGAVTGNAAGGYTITNSHTTGKTSIKVTKSWNDSNDADRIRPDSITAVIKATITKATGDEVVKEYPITISAANNWEYVENNLPTHYYEKDGDGKVLEYTITYTVEETGTYTGCIDALFTMKRPLKSKTEWLGFKRSFS